MLLRNSMPEKKGGGVGYQYPIALSYGGVILNGSIKCKKCFKEVKCHMQFYFFGM